MPGKAHRARTRVCPEGGSARSCPGCQSGVSVPKRQSYILLSGSAMLLFVSSVKLVAEIALLALAGQFLLGLLAGNKRESNFFYKLLQVLTGPFVKGMRAITPRVVIDRHIPLAAFVLLSTVWVVSTLLKINICLQIGVEQCR